MLTVNEKEALSRLDDDREIYDELITSFLQDSAGDFTRLGEAVSARNPEKTAYHAHKIKGAALTLGAEILAYHAEQLERASRNGEEIDYDSLFNEMETGYHAAVAELEKIRTDR